MKEWHRTLILVVLLIAALAFMFWLRHDYDSQAFQNLR